VHSKKIGTVLSVGLIQRFLFRFINPVRVIGLSRIQVKLFFDKADIATALHACNSNLGKVVAMCVEPHVFVQIVN
jgi:hypothetical protein